MIPATFYTAGTPAHAPLKAQMIILYIWPQKKRIKNPPFFILFLMNRLVGNDVAKLTGNGNTIRRSYGIFGPYVKSTG